MTLKEALIYVRDTPGHLEFHKWICNAISAVPYPGTYSLMKQFEALEPKDNEFTSYKYWISKTFRSQLELNSWWDIYEAKYNNELHKLLAEKRRFLTYLIEQVL